MCSGSAMDMRSMLIGFSAYTFINAKQNFEVNSQLSHTLHKNPTRSPQNNTNTITMVSIFLLRVTDLTTLLPMARGRWNSLVGRANAKDGFASSRVFKAVTECILLDAI